MKKLAILLVVVLALALPLTAIAGSAYSNARADFEPVPRTGAASGYVIINHARGQQNWQVQGSLQNLLPGTDYNVEVGTQGVWGGVTIATFVTDASGNKDFHNVATGLPEAYDVVRIVKGTGPSAPGLNKMVAREDGTWGLLQFRGTRRRK